ncbi:MAG TPA: hypothetical protein VMS09_17485 [Paenibacillus sp.]|uniref:hypothetical protein n=1 Tax=Paenibacillus sp. TaxID=58172 RepID=UPI0028D48616|nr:hypothetical protein [Paenibacillus sp.]HUC93779.1 hypothetical protein [Paenibacillus sp.]
MTQSRSTTAEMLAFIKNQVLTVTDITRSTKLTEILDSYAAKLPSEEVFVVQNTRNKDAQAVIADLEYFQELLMYKEAVEQAIDEIMYRVASERKDNPAEIDLAHVIADQDLDMERIMKLVEDGDFE